MQAVRSLPPYSAEGLCRHYGAISTEIVGVGLQLEADRRRGHNVVVEPLLVAIGNGRVLRREGHADLRIGVARPIPAGQRIGTQGLLAFELEQPAAGIRLSGLRGLAFNL